MNARDEHAEPGARAPAHVGHTLLISTLIACLVATVPSLRQEGAWPWLFWLASAGSGALVLGPALVGARAFASARRSLLPLLGALCVASGPVIALGSLIKAATNHRPLGAMTYAVIACTLVACAWAVTWRLYSTQRDTANATARRIAQLCLAGLVVGGVALAVLQLAGSGDVLVAVALDGALMLALSVLVLYAHPETKFPAPLPGLVGGLLWGGVVVAGIVAATGMGQATATVSLPMSVLGALVAH
jgi:hypothetical protein